MKAVVFDNSGTLVHRYRIIKDLSSGEFITNINSLDLIDKMETAALVVLQFNIDCLKKINQDMRVWDLIVDYDIGYDVSYSSMPVSDDEVDEILRNDDTIIADITEGLPILMEEVPRMELCIGSALILNVAEKRVAYTITTAGQLFENAADTGGNQDACRFFRCSGKPWIRFSHHGRKGRCCQKPQGQGI